MKTSEIRGVERAVAAGAMASVLVAALAGAGCRGPKVAQAPVAGTTTVTQPFSGSGQQAADGAEADVASDTLNVAVTATGGGPDAAAMTSRAKSAVESALAGAGFRLDASHPDLMVTLRAGAELFDQSGSYFVFNGSVEAEVTRMRDGRLVGKDRFETRGKRTLDREPALRALTDDLASQAKPWLLTACKPDQTGLKAEVLTVYFSRLSTASARAAYAEKFVRRLGNGREPGVFSCVLVEEDGATRSQKYRMVCEAKQFPAGLLNRLAGIEELGLRPSKPR
jgi:hypothetical protein